MRLNKAILRCAILGLAYEFNHVFRKSFYMKFTGLYRPRLGLEVAAQIILLAQLLPPLGQEANHSGEKVIFRLLTAQL